MDLQILSDRYVILCLFVCYLLTLDRRYSGDIRSDRGRLDEWVQQRSPRGVPFQLCRIHRGVCPANSRRSSA